jgi:hypothetical protein
MAGLIAKENKEKMRLAELEKAFAKKSGGPKQKNRDLMDELKSKINQPRKGVEVDEHGNLTLPTKREQPSSPLLNEVTNFDQKKLRKANKPDNVIDTQAKTGVLSLDFGKKKFTLRQLKRDKKYLKSI